MLDKIEGNKYVFVDMHVFGEMPQSNILFSDYILKPGDLTKKELLESTGMIEIDVPLIEENVRCLYELSSRHAKEIQLDINKYVSLSYLLMNEVDPEKQTLLKRLISHSWYRYLFKRHKKIRKKFCQKYPAVISVGVILCYMPYIVSKITSQNTKFYKCVTESDFAIRKHILENNSTKKPKIITNDTDILILLSDINCSVELHIKNEIHRINPIRFWFRVFGTTMDNTLIKLLCVLMGTDMNPYHPASPIHIKQFQQILTNMDLSKYDELTIDNLKKYILDVISKNPDSTNIKETVTAINIYLNDIEIGTYEITPKNYEEINYLE
jgi:hypothetical protein